MSYQLAINNKIKKQIYYRMIRICYCIVWHYISRVCNVWEAFIGFFVGFGLLLLHVEMLIAFSRPLC